MFHISRKPLAKWPSEISVSLCRHSCLQMIEISCLQSTGLMPPPRSPIIKLASLYFHYRFLATKRRGTFMNANNLYSSRRQTFPESPAEMNERISGISSCNTRLKHKIFSFFSLCTEKALLMWLFYLKITYIFLSRDFFFESSHIISPQRHNNPLFLSGSLALSAGWFDGWGNFFTVCRINVWQCDKCTAGHVTGLYFKKENN